MPKKLALSSFVTRGRWDPVTHLGLDLYAMAFLASAWGLQTAGMTRRLQELKTPAVAFGYLWDWRPKSWSCRKLTTFGSHDVCSMLLHQVRP